MFHDEIRTGQLDFALAGGAGRRAGRFTPADPRGASGDLRAVQPSAMVPGRSGFSRLRLDLVCLWLAVLLGPGLPADLPGVVTLAAAACLRPAGRAAGAALLVGLPAGSQGGGRLVHPARRLGFPGRPRHRHQPGLNARADAGWSQPGLRLGIRGVRVYFLLERHPWPQPVVPLAGPAAGQAGKSPASMLESWLKPTGCQPACTPKERRPSTNLAIPLVPANRPPKICDFYGPGTWVTTVRRHG